MKNNKALDNIRNTIAGHIQIDYRIACTMINFLHKPSCPDGVNATKIANRMKRKANSIIQENHLSPLLTIRFNTKKNPLSDLSNINDFPRLKKKQLIAKIFLGTFQLRLCKSYVSDLLRNHSCFIFENNKIENFKGKIFGVEISSRHKRGEIKTKNQEEKTKLRVKYKAIIQYNPLLKNHKSILSKFKTKFFK